LHWPAKSDWILRTSGCTSTRREMAIVLWIDSNRRALVVLYLRHRSPQIPESKYNTSKDSADDVTLHALLPGVGLTAVIGVDSNRISVLTFHPTIHLALDFMSQYTVEEVTRREDLDGIVDVIWAATDGINPSHGIIYPILGSKPADREAATQWSKDRT